MENQNRFYFPTYPAQNPGIPHKQRARTSLDWLFLTTTGRIVFILVLGVFLFLPIAIVAGFLSYFQVYEQIVPGVAVGGTHLGGLNIQNAAIRIHQDWNMDRKILVGTAINGQLKTWQVTPAELGLTVNALETAKNAYAVAHDQDWLNEIDQTFRSSFKGWGLAPVIVFDQGTARSGLEKLANQVAIAPVDASLAIENGQVIETAPVPGSSLDIDRAIEQISADPLNVYLSGTFVLPVAKVEPEVSDLSAAKAEILRLMDTPVKIIAYDPINNEHLQWNIPQDQLRSWLTTDPSESPAKVTILPDKVEDYLAQLSSNFSDERWVDADRFAPEVKAAILENKPVSLVISHHPTSYSVHSGDTLLKIGWKTGIPYWRIAQANPNIKPDRLQVGQELVIPSKDDLLPLPVIPNKRIVISISEQRLWTYEDDQLRSETIISTGIDRSPTQPGIFQIQTHEVEAYAAEWDLTMPHFMGIYEAWPGFMNGLHGLPTLSNGQRLWESILGKPASYGCIILNLNDAEDLFNWAENGVVVEIQP